MLPQFFDLIGVTSRGALFEQILWILVFAAGMVVCVRETAARHPLQDAWYGWLIGLGLAGFGGWRFFETTVNNQLYFGADGLNISNYGLAIASGFVVGIYVCVRESNRGPQPPTMSNIFDLAFWVLVASMLGARLLFTLVSWRDYYDLCVEDGDCLSALMFWKGGLVFLGGVIGALVAGWVYCRRQKIEFLRSCDLVIPSLALGQFFGRLGCLSVGCCFGRHAEIPWAIQMPFGSAAFEQHYAAAQQAVSRHASELWASGLSDPIHPTQLYEASGELVFFALLLLVRSRKRFHGQVLATWLVLYSVLRFVVELFRGDTIRGFLFEWSIPGFNEFIGVAATEPTLLSTSQMLTLGMGAAGVFLFWRNRKRWRSPVAAARPAISS